MMYWQDVADDDDDEGTKKSKKTTKKWINGCHDYKIYLLLLCRYMLNTNI